MSSLNSVTPSWRRWMPTTQRRQCPSVTILYLQLWPVPRCVQRLRRSGECYDKTKLLWTVMFMPDWGTDLWIAFCVYAFHSFEQKLLCDITTEENISCQNCNNFNTHWSKPLYSLKCGVLNLNVFLYKFIH